MYLSLSLRAWDCVASARRGLPFGRKIYLLTYVNPEAAVPDAAPHATVRLDFPCWVPAASPCVPDAPHVLPIRLASGAHGV